jgi:hypothetical protein
MGFLRADILAQSVYSVLQFHCPQSIAASFAHLPSFEHVRLFWLVVEGKE